MRLIVVIGYPDESRASTPFPVYAGRDSAEADAAMEASEAAVFDVIKNPTTIRKRRKTALAAAPAANPDEGAKPDESTKPDEGAMAPIGEKGVDGTEGTPDPESTESPAVPVKTVPTGTVSGKRKA